jgi:hypothetical protein
MSHINIITVHVASPCAILCALLVVGVPDMGLLGLPVSGAEFLDYQRRSIAERKDSVAEQPCNHRHLTL